MDALLACVLTGLLLKLLLHKLPVRYPTDDRWNVKKVPTAGGIAFVVIYLLSLASHLDLWPLLVASLLISGVGLIDDLEPVSPGVKLSLETAMAVGLIFFGWRLEWSDYPFLVLGLSVLWMVGFTNSFNLLDNMDGLATGTSIIALSFVIMIDPSPAALVLLGGLCGFLIFNFPQARVFMGDCGSLFLGLNMACLTMDLGFSAIPILIVPMADTTFVTVRRLLKGKSPAHGGLDHLSHELARVTGSQLLAIVLLWSAGLLGGLVGLWMA